MSPRQLAWQRVEPDISTRLQKRVARALPAFAPWSVDAWEAVIRSTAAALIEKEGRYHGPPGGGRW